VNHRFLLAVIVGLLSGLFGPAAHAASKFQISYTAAAHSGPLTGRLILLLAKQAEPEPRMLISRPIGPAMFGLDLHELRAGDPVTIDGSAVGYPTGLTELPPGDYYAQALVNVYTQVHRADGHTLWLRVNDGTNESWVNTTPGNLYSEVQKVHVTATGTIRLQITKVIPAVPREADTEWVKHVSIQSRKLSEFWGRPVWIHATVLLPKGYAEHPEIKYPSVYTLGHGVPFWFSTDPAQATGKVDPRTGLDGGYDFYQSWVAERFPRFIAISLEQRTPYFLDAYSVNSANNGPYGDAVIQEVIPYLEQHFRIIGAPYARVVEGASTNGWQTLALLLRNPDFLGGAWILQPDPIDFRHYQQTDIYHDDNAFAVPSGPFTMTERPMRRTVAGQVVWTQRQMSRYEEVLGSHGRSEQQLEGWEAVYGPVGADGYPRPLWDKLTGKIDHEVADYMRDHGFDLREYAQRNWSTLGPKLIGKLHFSCGDMDDFYLNLGVYDFQEFLQGTSNPHYEGEFVFGRPMKGHMWHPATWSELARQMATYILQNAPAGSGNAWNY